MDDNQVYKLWCEFEDVSVNENDEIESDFYEWKKGTEKTEIWHWFDENYSGGLKSLMNL